MRPSAATHISRKKPFEAQVRLVSTAIADGGDLASQLASVGICYDDLIYEQSQEKQWIGSRPISLTDFEPMVAGVPLVSFFTGCGGMDLGFEALGFDHIAAFEFNEIFCRTVRKNRPSWKVFGPPFGNGDVSKFDEVVEALEPLITKPFDGVFVGGPPCQPFSIAANQRFSRSGDNFKRVGFAHEKNGNLLFDYVKLIIHFKPKVFVVENVPGLRDLDGGEQLSAAIEMLCDHGYTVNEPTIYDAADHGVPQHRERLFVVGSRTNGEFKGLRRHPHVGCASVLAQVPNGLPNHETRTHKAGSIERYMRLRYGQRDQLGRVDRLDPTLPSKTVIAGGTNGGGRSHLHPEIPRTLSVRECARLQTFPDDYVFLGPTARQFTQVGNAVPPVLAAALAASIAEAYYPLKVPVMATSRT
ncbi:DNA cytosine methyltransferase [Sphingobium xenophagum]|jgi:DNA (cytosine-5)-methyltransferase 1|uniref:DNA (cytosine-5-)-methyltransferase n=1 Tax=Sphingobium xenophagum TaxID=121428 RepID=A0A401IYB8_SPHXE|nr:DNA cytosine methyltransferase [Sphingobium xenophagum]MBY0582321.1 DNA cytosine methyltransferase [Sphingomonas sp.]GBH29359.1 DNA (cytosine-5)-methyltransferase 1 [Sphingobium xenophagum]